MNSNNFFSSSASLQGLVNSERFKPLFKNTETNANSANQSLKASLGVDINIRSMNGKQVFAKSIEFSLGVKLESSYEFKVPSPKDVAATVLGFVENRLNSEKAAGASTERLSDLLSQARAGVEKGYAQAEKDIKGLGLMTDELAEEISKGFDQISLGLNDLEQNFVGTVPVPADVSVPTTDSVLTNVSVSTTGSDAVEKQAAEASASVPAQSVQVSPELFKGASVQESKSAASGSSSSMLVNDITASSADFVLNTREGDQVLIRFADIERLRAQQSDDGMALSLSQQSQFQFAIKGDLSEQEISAINEVLEQVGNISRLFFDDQFEQAFQSAMQLGFDSEQIASLSLDLSKTQIQEVRVYEGAAKGALESYKRNQPLINMTQQFERLESMLSPFKRFEELNSMIDELVSKAIDQYALIDAYETEKKDGQQVSNYQDFAKKLMSSIESMGA